MHSWTEEDIERVRIILPKIANGRKTRYQKKQQSVHGKPGSSILSTRQSAKAKSKSKSSSRKRKARGSKD